MEYPLQKQYNENGLFKKPFEDDLHFQFVIIGNSESCSV